MCFGNIQLYFFLLLYIFEKEFSGDLIIKEVIEPLHTSPSPAHASLPQMTWDIHSSSLLCWHVIIHLLIFFTPANVSEKDTSWQHMKQASHCPPPISAEATVTSLK